MYKLVSDKMFAVFVLFLLKVFVVDSFYIPKFETTNDTAEEIQNALCTISTKEIEASANATITRQLKGVCTSNELNSKIDNLQTNILREIDGIKYMLELNAFKIPNSNLKNTELTRNVQYIEGSPNKLKETKIALPRMEEILIHNNTVMDTAEGGKYFYYWRIENIRQLLAKRDMYKSSPYFQVLGHNLRLKFYPNHLKNDYFGIELRPDSQGFLKKHKFTILNQSSSASNVTSGLLYGIHVDSRVFRVAESKLGQEGYIIENSVIVKLEMKLVKIFVKIKK